MAKLATKSNTEQPNPDVAPVPRSEVSLPERARLETVGVDPAAGDQKAAGGPAAAGGPDVGRVCLVLLTAMAGLAVLYFARAVMLPTVMALLLALLLRPVVRWCARRRIPESLSAAFLVAGLVIVIGAGLSRLQGPAAQWIHDAPTRFREVEHKLRRVYQPIEDIEKASQKLAELAPSEPADRPLEVEVKQPGISSVLVGTTATFLAGAVVVFTLTYFLLATGDALLCGIVQILPHLADKKKVVELVHNLEQAVSSYLLAVGIINGCLGVVLAGAAWLLGLPNPALWGLVACCLNFIPFLGPMATTVIIFLVAVLTFDTIERALLAPLLFTAIYMVEGNLITPYLLGRSFRLNPILVFLSLTLWSWMWGIGGMLLAIPLLAILKISFDHFEKTKPIGALFAH